MGVLQDETFSDALKLALATGMLSRTMPFAFSGQASVIFLAPPPCYDFMNLTTMKPLTIPNPYLQFPGWTMTLQPSYVAIPFYTITPLFPLQAEAPPPHSIPSPHPPSHAFWNAVERTVEHSVHGAATLAWLSSALAKVTSQKDPAPPRDDRQLPSSDSFDLDSLPSLSTEDDLLCVDMTELRSIPSSELYLGEAEPVIAPSAIPRMVSIRTRPSLLPRPSTSGTTLVTPPEGYLPSEDLSVLLQIPDRELYFNLEHLGELGATPPRRLNSLAIATSTLSLA